MKKILMVALLATTFAGSANAGGWDAWDLFWGTQLPNAVKNVLDTINPELFTIDVDLNVDVTKGK